MREKSLYDEITKGVADAIIDIREKVIEEGYFGRVVTDSRVTEMNFGWPALPEKQQEAGQLEQDHEPDVADSGIDR